MKMDYNYLKGELMEKKCSKCKLSKKIEEFGRCKVSKDGLRSYCKQCQIEYTRARNRTKEGLISKIYHSQTARCRKKGYPMPTYTRQWLIEWMMKNEDFHKLFDAWAKNGYKKDDVPSVDRLDDYTTYTEDNIRVITWAENRTKGHRDRKSGINNKQNRAIIQYDLDGNYIKEFYSISEASRQLKTTIENIHGACSGKQSTAGGFKWAYAESEE